MKAEREKLLKVVEAARGWYCYGNNKELMDALKELEK